MAGTARILAICGSTRKNSSNLKLLRKIAAVSEESFSFSFFVLVCWGCFYIANTYLRHDHVAELGQRNVRIMGIEGARPSLLGQDMPPAMTDGRPASDFEPPAEGEANEARAAPTARATTALCT